MHREFLIDGYNFLWAWSKGRRLRPGPGNLERARAALVGYVGNRIVAPDSATIVFDASADPANKGSPPVADAKGVAVRFSTGYPNADELIREICQKHSAPKQLVVVSDDREVKKHAQRRKATPMSCAEFEALVTARPVAHRPARSPAEKPEPGSTDSAFWSNVFADAAESTKPPRSGAQVPKPVPGRAGKK